MITPRILIATINGNPKTTVISCYSPTNVSDEVEVERFYENLTSVTRQIPKHNFLVMAGDLNAHLGQLDGFKYAYHYQTNRNGSMLRDYLLENNLLYLNFLFQKRPGQRWTHRSPNGNINRKFKNSAKNGRAFNSFVTLSQTIVLSLPKSTSLRANK